MRTFAKSEGKALKSAQNAQGLVMVSVFGRFERILGERARPWPERGRRLLSDDRALQVAVALETAYRLRTLLGDGFADRERGFEYALARLPNASPDRDRADRAEAALAERTRQLAEALFAASARADAFVEGLADRDLRFAGFEALSDRRLYLEALRQEELRDALRRLEERLEARSMQLAESLLATKRTRAILIEILRLYGEAFVLLRSRLEVDRQVAIKSPNIVRRFVRVLKRGVPSPVARAGRALRSRVSRR